MSTKFKKISNKSALIVGCGYVGSKLMELLSENGWEVEGIKRTKSTDSRMMSAEVDKPFTLSKQYDVVFYMVSSGRFDVEAYEKAYVTGVANTINAVRNHSKKTTRLIFVSSTSLFAENTGEIVDESSPVDVSAFSKKSLNQGETLVSESGFSYAIVRFSGIYGPGRTHLIDSVRSQKAKLRALPYISNRIHVDDCAGALAHLADVEEVENIYIASDDEPTPYNEVLKWLSNYLDVAEPQMDSDLTPSSHMSNKKCSNALLLASGYKMKYSSFREGFKSCI